MNESQPDYTFDTLLNTSDMTLLPDAFRAERFDTKRLNGSVRENSLFRCTGEAFRVTVNGWSLSAHFACYRYHGHVNGITVVHKQSGLGLPAVFDDIRQALSVVDALESGSESWGMAIEFGGAGADEMKAQVVSDFGGLESLNLAVSQAAGWLHEGFL
jgi:hypothetical protein